MQVNNDLTIHDDNVFNWDYLVTHPHSIRRKIAIVYAGRSGSMMLSCLLDSHSHLVSFNCYCDASLYARLIEFTQSENPSVERFKEFISIWYQDIMNEYYQHPLLPKGQMQEQLPKSIFMDNINAICRGVSNSDLTLDFLINIVFIAYGKGLNRPLSTKSPNLVIQIHSPFFYEGWQNLYKNIENLDVIVMTRNTVKAIDSHFYHHLYELLSPPWCDFFERILIEYNKSFLPFYDAQMQNKSNCIYFEDLHNDGEGALRKLCEYIGIPYEEILLQETISGSMAQFPSAGKVVSGSNAERAKNGSLRVLQKSDLALVEYIFKDIIKNLGYELKSNSLQRLLSVMFLTRLELKMIKFDVLEHIKSSREQEKITSGINNRVKFNLKVFLKILSAIMKVSLGHIRLLKMGIHNRRRILRINKISQRN